MVFVYVCSSGCEWVKFDAGVYRTKKKKKSHIEIYILMKIIVKFAFNWIVKLYKLDSLNENWNFGGKFSKVAIIVFEHTHTNFFGVFEKEVVKAILLFWKTKVGGSGN